MPLSGNLSSSFRISLGTGISAILSAWKKKTSPSRTLAASAQGPLSYFARAVYWARAPSARLIATDLNPPMLAVAKRKFDEGENVEFKPADAMALPFGDAAFDLLVCQFGVMFFPDKPVSFREAGRVLRSGGRYLFNIWGSMPENPFSETVQNVVTQFFPDDPPGFYRVPFGYSDQSVVMADMEAGGLKDLTCETISINKDVADWDLFAHGLVYGNPLIDEINNRGGVEAEAVEQAILSALRERFGREPSSMPLLAAVYSGCAA